MKLKQVQNSLTPPKAYRWGVVEESESKKITALAGYRIHFAHAHPP